MDILLIIILAIAISVLVLIGFIFALPLRIGVLRNQSELFRRRPAFFLGLMAFIFVFALIALEQALLTMAANCSGGVPLTCPSSTSEEKRTLLKQELWLRNMLP